MYYIIILTCNLLILLITIQFFNDFLIFRAENKLIRTFFGIIWYVGIFIISEFIGIPLLNFLYNLILLFFISLSYDGTIYKRVFTCLTFSVFGAICDFFSYQFFINLIEDESLVYHLSLIFAVILLWFFERMVFLISKNQKEKYIGFKETLIVLTIPLFSLIILVTLTYLNVNNIIITIISLCVLMICFMTFVILHYIIISQAKKADQLLMYQQMESYARELDKIKDNELRIEGLRHDLKNHLIEIKSMALNDNNEKLISYIDSLSSDLPSVSKYSNSGKFEIDALINYLLDKAENFLDDINVSITIPYDLELDIYSLNIILGNLLENAIRASSASDDKKLHLSLYVKDNILYLDLKNTYSGRLFTKDGVYFSTKENHINHGYGLKNVIRMINQMNGKIELSHDEYYFKVNAMFYLS